MATATDIRVMVPRVRRAIEGPVPLPDPLDDAVLRDITADALADVVLYVGSVFGKTLDVSAVDPDTGAPAEYTTSDPLSLEEQAVIAAQAALNYYFYKLAGQKTMERIEDEAGVWEWQTSANLLRDMLAALRAARDKALDALLLSDAPLDTYASFLHVRDHRVADLIEPWTTDAGSGVGVVAYLDTGYDLRFGGF